MDCPIQTKAEHSNNLASRKRRTTVAPHYCQTHQPPQSPAKRRSHWEKRWRPYYHQVNRLLTMGWLIRVWLFKLPDPLLEFEKVIFFHRWLKVMSNLKHIWQFGLCHRINKPKEISLVCWHWLCCYTRRWGPCLKVCLVCRLVCHH